jgi:hypothetical protein
MSGEATRSFLGPIPRVTLRADARLVISLGMLIDQLLPHLLSSADNISARLGCRRDDEVAK